MKTSLLFTCPIALLCLQGAWADNITDNSYDDRNPQISGDLIVWEAQIPDAPAEPPAEPPAETTEPPAEPAPVDWELMVKYGDAERRLTDNDGDDINACIDGTTVVWQSWDGTDWEIWAFNADADVMAQLTDNDTDDINPCVSGNTVVWQAMDPEGDFEIASTSIASLIPHDAELKITPRTLNLRSRGRWVNAQLSMDDPDISLADVDPATILLMDSIPAENVRVTGSRISMKFDREALATLLSGSGDSAEVTISASTTGGDVILASDTIRIIE